MTHWWLTLCLDVTVQEPQHGYYARPVGYTSWGRRRVAALRLWLWMSIMSLDCDSVDEKPRMSLFVTLSVVLLFEFFFEYSLSGKMQNRPVS